MAEMDGLLHKIQVQGSTLVAEGTALAQIYPKITNEKKIKIVTYVSSRMYLLLKMETRCALSQLMMLTNK